LDLRLFGRDARSAPDRLDRRQRRDQLLVLAEEVLHPRTVTTEWGSAIEAVNGVIKRLVRSSELRRHRVAIIEISKRCIRKPLSRFQHSSRKGSNLSTLGIGRGWPGESIVDNTDGVLKIALNPTSDVS
jgi:hypothetical protein